MGGADQSKWGHSGLQITNAHMTVRRTFSAPSGAPGEQSASNSSNRSALAPLPAPLYSHRKKSPTRNATTQRLPPPGGRGRCSEASSPQKAAVRPYMVQTARKDWAITQKAAWFMLHRIREAMDLAWSCSAGVECPTLEARILRANRSCGMRERRRRRLFSNRRTVAPRGAGVDDDVLFTIDPGHLYPWPTETCIR